MLVLHTLQKSASAFTSDTPETFNLCLRCVSSWCQWPTLKCPLSSLEKTLQVCDLTHCCAERSYYSSEVQTCVCVCVCRSTRDRFAVVQPMHLPSPWISFQTCVSESCRRWSVPKWRHHSYVLYVLLLGHSKAYSTWNSLVRNEGNFGDPFQNLYSNSLNVASNDESFMLQLSVPWGNSLLAVPGLQNFLKCPHTPSLGSCNSVPNQTTKLRKDLVAMNQESDGTKTQIASTYDSAQKKTGAGTDYIAINIKQPSFVNILVKLTRYDLIVRSRLEIWS